LEAADWGPFASLSREIDMTASIAPNRAGLGTLVSLAVAVAVATASPAAATIIDSFTDPLPMNPQLPVSGARILFLGSRCDGAACPPGTIVTNPEPLDRTGQSGLPGIPARFRKVDFGTYFEPNPGSAGTLSIDPDDGGRLALESPGGPMLTVHLNYGDWENPMNLDLRADGSDRLEIDIPTLSLQPFGALQVVVRLLRGTGASTQHAGRAYMVPGAGTLVIPYSDLAGLEDFDDDVESFEFHFNFNHALAPGELVVGEIRTASAPTGTASSSWGRIKSAYRR
jgi:hypothetical protein